MKGEINCKQSDNNLINLVPHLQALQNEVLKLKTGIYLSH